MLAPMATLWADPWNPDYGMGFEALTEDAPLPHADPFVETRDWSAPVAPHRAPPDELWFVDGVRRVELRLLADDDGRRVPGLFGSFAVGSVRCAARAAFGEHRVRRALVLGGGVANNRVEVPCGASSLVFEPTADERTDPNGPLERLQDLMRREEESLTAHLSLQGAALVLADGPLRLREPSTAPAVGVVKRFVRRYLEPEQEGLLGALGSGERTPVFALCDEDGTTRGYSWYTRIAAAGPVWHDHAGLVRCEIRPGPGVDAAVDLADLVASALPRFAGRPSDPRTPQNLAPVAGLETWLRHRMGDRGLIRRSLLAWIAARAA
jgi:hypothetical protein